MGTVYCKRMIRGYSLDGSLLRQELVENGQFYDTYKDAPKLFPIVRELARANMIILFATHKKNGGLS